MNPNILIRPVLDEATHGTPAPGPKDGFEWNRQLIAVRELGAAPWKWLGGRDSNPDNVVQSHVSYR